VHHHGVRIVGLRRHRVLAPGDAAIAARHHPDDAVGDDDPEISKTENNIVYSDS
jgi:hypothetical protein